MFYFTKNTKNSKYYGSSPYYRYSEKTPRSVKCNNNKSLIYHHERLSDRPAFPKSDNSFRHLSFQELLLDINELFELMVEDFPEISCPKLESMLLGDYISPESLQEVLIPVLWEVSGLYNGYAKRLLDDLSCLHALSRKSLS